MIGECRGINTEKRKLNVKWSAEAADDLKLGYKGVSCIGDATIMVWDVEKGKMMPTKFSKDELPDELKD